MAHLLEVSGVDPVLVIPTSACACLVLIVCRVDDNLSEWCDTARCCGDHITQHVWIQALLPNLRY